MIRILEAQTFDWTESAKGNMPDTSQGVALIDITNDNQDLDQLASYIDNAYAYQIYDVAEENVPTGVALFLNQDKTFTSNKVASPISAEHKKNISAATYLAQEPEDIVAASDFKQELQQQLQAAILDSQQKIISKMIDNLDQSGTKWVMNPAGSNIFCPVSKEDRITAAGIQIWPPAREVNPSYKKSSFKP